MCNSYKSLLKFGYYKTKSRWVRRNIFPFSERSNNDEFQVSGKEIEDILKRTGGLLVVAVTYQCSEALMIPKGIRYIAFPVGEGRRKLNKVFFTDKDFYRRNSSISISCFTTVDIYFNDRGVFSSYSGFGILDWDEELLEYSIDLCRPGTYKSNWFDRAGCTGSYQKELEGRIWNDFIFS